MAGELKTIKICDVLIKIKKNPPDSEGVLENKLTEHFKDANTRRLEDIRNISIENLKIAIGTNFFGVFRISKEHIAQRYNHLYSKEVYKTLLQVIKNRE